MVDTRPLLIKVARVLAREVSHRFIQNQDSQRRVDLMYEILDALGCNSEEIKTTVSKSKTYEECRRIINDQIAIVELCQ